MDPKLSKRNSFYLALMLATMLLVAPALGYAQPLEVAQQPDKTPAAVNSTVLLSEDFEDGVLDPLLTVSPVGTFNNPPGIKDRTEFGSAKAFGFGLSTCGSSCFGNFMTTLSIGFSEPTFVSTLSFRAMELYGNWGSFGWVEVDGVRITNTNDISHPTDNGGVPDSLYREKRYNINEKVSRIDLVVWDITTASEVFIDDLELTGKPCRALPDGALAWWSGDGHAFDLLGDNHGSLVNGATYGGGVDGRAFSFDGINDTVLIPNSTSIQALGDHFSIEAFVRPESLPSGDPYYDRGIVVKEGYAAGFALMTKGNAFGLWIGSGNTPVPYALSQPITAGRWYHVVGTYDGTSARIYVNGILEGTQAASLAHYDNPISLGSTAGGDRFFQGQIDEVVLYNRMLNDEEIYDLYDGRLSQIPADMVLYWPFDEGSGFTTDDVMGTNDGTLTNGPVWVSGKVGGALSFDGVDDYVAIPDAASNLVKNDTGAIAAWVNPATVVGNDVLIAFGSIPCSNTTVGLGIWGHVRPWHCLGGYDWDSSIPVSANVWTHLVYSWDSINETIYKNGVFAESRPRTFNYSPGQARIGHGFWGDSDNAYPGLIDELMVFDRSLSPDEVRGLYFSGAAAPQDPAAKWTFEEGSGTTTVDIMGTNDGTLTNDPAWTSGKHGLSLRFDGVNDYVAAADSALWDLGDDDFTIDGWVNTTAPNSTMRLISAGSEADGANNLWSFGYGANGAWGGGNRLNLTFFNGSSYTDFSSSQVNLPSGIWSHIALVREGSALIFYFNGSPVGTQNIGSQALDGGSSGAIIGARYSSSTASVLEFATGFVDEVEVFQRALSAEEIVAIYTAGGPVKCKPCLTAPDGLQGFWPANEGSGDKANDIVGNNDGTLEGPLWSTGKVDGALWFDGGDDYVHISDSSKWDLGSGDFSIDGWVRTDTPGSTMRLLSAGSEKDGDFGLWSFGYGSSGPWGAGSRLDFFYFDGSNYHDFNSDIITLETGTWHLIGVARSGETLTFYFNGVPVGSRTIGTAAPGGGFRGALIGARWFNGSTIMEYASGLIDEVELYDHALSAEQFAALYSAGCAGKCAGDTQAPLVLSITRLDENPTSASNVDYQVTFSEPVEDLGGADFSFTTTGSLSGVSVVDIAPNIDLTTFTVTVSTGTGSGTLRLDIPTSATVYDVAQNPLGNRPFQSGEVYTIRYSYLYVPVARKQ